MKNLKKNSIEADIKCYMLIKKANLRKNEKQYKFLMQST